MTPFEHAKKYYPKYWSASRILKLYQKGKLTAEEYNEIVGGETGGEAAANEQGENHGIYKV